MYEVCFSAGGHLQTAVNFRLDVNGPFFSSSE